MTELLHGLSDWVVGFASSDWAIVALVLVSFAESIFFPIPPDPLLIGMALIQPSMALWLGVLVTLSSVAGALVGHWLGMHLGRPVLYKFLPERPVEMAEDALTRYGVWATLASAITPIPYKVFAISAGVLGLDRRTFVLASLVGRGVRFLTVAALVMFFGESIKEFIAGNFAVVTVVFVVALVVGAFVWDMLRRRRRAARALEQEAP